MDLVYKHEKPLFFIAFTIATLFWLALLVGTVGIVLIYVLIGFIVYLFVHSGFISYLKGTGVRITESQYPDIHARLVRCCQKVGLDEIPEAYLLRTDFFNALATRFLGRHFVVLFTDVVDALEARPNALDFYIGHELGHIHRKHLRWNSYLFPALLLPLLGTAYRRAEEYTCDRYGAACCENAEDVAAAIAAIAAGDTRWKSISVNAYLGQVATTNGFWMSFNELTSDYPWLTKRMAAALALKQNKTIKLPRRNPMAWLLSAFVPRFGAGGMVSLFVTVAVIGILAAIAIPAYQDYKLRTLHTQAYQSAVGVQAAVTRYAQANQAWPESMLDLGYESAMVEDESGIFEIGIYQDGMIGVFTGMTTDGNERYVVLEPAVDGGNITWYCYGDNIEDKLLPTQCR